MGEVVRTDAGLAFPPGLLAWWQQEFPQVDVPATVRFIADYARTRPQWAAGKRNWRLVILRWLKRDAEKIAARGLRRPTPRSETIQERAERYTTALRRVTAPAAGGK